MHGRDDGQAELMIIEPDRPEHTCDLPWRSDGYGCTGHPDYSIMRCGSCGTAWFAAPCYESLGPTQRWRRIRWWHRRLLKRLAAFEQEPRR